VIPKKQYLVLFGCLCFSQVSLPIAGAQTAVVGPKQTVASQEASENSELDHMNHLIAKLKSDTAKIQDPAAKSAAIDNLDLWQHMLDKMLRENPNANNVGAEHHHENDPAPPALKQSPKPQ
jgi:hypothetical protein